MQHNVQDEHYRSDCSRYRSTNLCAHNHTKITVNTVSHWNVFSALSTLQRTVVCGQEWHPGNSFDRQTVYATCYDVIRRSEIQLTSLHAQNFQSALAET